MPINVLTLGDRINVTCRFCHDTHQIQGYQGNNIHWEDADGWSGSFDVAHGAFSPQHEAHSICPTCLSLDADHRQNLLDAKADRMLHAQTS